jgi:ketosteroid isomerase-like protein
LHYLLLQERFRQAGSALSRNRRINRVRKRYLSISTVAAAVFISLCAGQSTEMSVHASQKITNAGTESAMPMTSEQNSETTSAKTRMVIDRFNEAFNRHDADALAVRLTDDTVFEDTSPAPDGRRVEGKAAVVALWRAWFAKNADAVFEAEDVIVSGNRAVVLWIYRKQRAGQPWHLRGVDVFTVRDGKVAAKLAYVKG